MYLYYDRVSKMYTLDTGEDIEFLGPMTQAMLKLKNVTDCTMSQAREAVLRAFFNGGDAVSLENVKKMASLFKKIKTSSKESMGAKDLNEIKVLYRDPHGSMSLWGIPYRMRPGQEPRDLEKRPRRNWMYLGVPGAEKNDVVKWLRSLDEDLIPHNPGEWTDITD